MTDIDYCIYTGLPDTNVLPDAKVQWGFLKVHQGGAARSFDFRTWCSDTTSTEVWPPVSLGKLVRPEKWQKTVCQEVAAIITPDKKGPPHQDYMGLPRYSGELISKHIWSQLSQFFAWPLGRSQPLWTQKVDGKSNEMLQQRSFNSPSVKLYNRTLRPKESEKAGKGCPKCHNCCTLKLESRLGKLMAPLLPLPPNPPHFLTDTLEASSYTSQCAAASSAEPIENGFSIGIFSDWTKLG